MEKLELKHIKPYIGTGLKSLYGNPPHINYKEVEIIGVVHREFETHPTRILADNMDSEHIWMFKPLLHPLSRLTEPINHNGNEVDVLSELGLFKESVYKNSIVDFRTGHKIRYGLLEYDRVETLIKYHFDVFGLIEIGLAEPIKLNK